MRFLKQMILASIVILGTLQSLAGLAAQQTDPEILLRAAIESEEVDGDLEAAIETYKQIASSAGSNRALAATALLRLGGCYEKLGREEAQKASACPHGRPTTLRLSLKDLEKQFKRT